MNNLFIGNNPVISGRKELTGQFVLMGDEKFYQIRNYDSMQPFFISLASDSNHWMYISSTGGLTAGRKNPDQALFPYYTDDKITESAEITGSKTILQVHKKGRTYLWEPFSDRNKGVYDLERTISKSIFGNKLIFSEKNTELGLTYSYGWMNADDFGWVKKSWLVNDSDEWITVSLVDGLQNILPSGIDRITQNTFSTLVDGYKKTELLEGSGLALFRMEAILVDRAEPSESLRVNTVWNYGLENASYLLSSTQLDAFRRGLTIIPEHESKGVRGAFFAACKLTLEAYETKAWYFMAETNQDAARVNNLTEFIRNTEDIASVLEKNIEKGTLALLSIVSQADGIQFTADENDNARHFSNVLFNAMRGGIYNENYTIYAADFINHVKHFNVKVWERNNEFLTGIPVSIEYAELESKIQHQKDLNLYRLFLEYLPLTFSRRHGDPSRPWNLFDIRVKDEAGNKILSYQGNWRDIFQNWEALSISFPGYINGVISKFVNATTADGYNPYKVTSEGIEWEVIEPENPWSNIGYWGDHQIIYLLKLMEVSRNHYPECLASWLNKELFAYANVPYRLKNYADIVAQPKNSIRFDAQLEASIEKLLPTYGSDAKLILDPQGEVMLVSFTEKILATLLAKLSNFIPEAGIWMNTLRPEWNDANNALVGSGASMVTLYYIRRFLTFVSDLYQDSPDSSFTISVEISVFFDRINSSFIHFAQQLRTGFDDQKRRMMTDELGQAGSDYRTVIYSGFSGAKSILDKSVLHDFLALALQYADQSIEANKRSDNLYHAYNLVTFTDDAISIRNLYEMLEGQVAVLSSGKLSPGETLCLLDDLRISSLYRPDQESYILYPNKKLPLFLDKNLIPKEEVERSKVLNDLVAMGDTSIINTDKKGYFHFNADFNNVGFLTAALNRLKTTSGLTISESDQQAIEQLYERIFDHKSFTGRSGTFYKYEGLGCIYWHMVSKLLLAIGEGIQQAVSLQAGPETLNRLRQHYNAVQKGIGAHKSPADYGSFPFDPYSHTPMMAGVQQPGMTGQVKEDIINRFFELGMSVHEGLLTIRPVILNKDKFIQPDSTLQSVFTSPYLSFSYCSVSFVFLLDGNSGIDIHYQDRNAETIKGYSLSPVQSQAVFNRDPTIQKIIVHLKNID
jgi:CRISPR/Cas system endoribonuclease Cas6 (RAMP superfamily)